MPSLKYRNLDNTESYRALKTRTRPVLSEEINAKRIGGYDTPVAAGLRYNYAAKFVDESILSDLSDLADEQSLVEKYLALAGGEMMNTGEQRKVMHHLLRGRISASEAKAEAKAETSGIEDIETLYTRERDRFFAFADNIRSGKITGSTGKSFQEIVQIGIGGSDLGPRALYIALKNHVAPADQLAARFISNVDPDDPSEIISSLDLERTMFVLVSKSGTTQETLTNRRFVLEAAKDANIRGFVPSKHMVVVTSQSSPLARSGDFLDAFDIDDYVGGRYSSTSAVGGVVLSCALGPSVFEELLTGAHESDIAAAKKNIKENPALLDALIGVYERSILGFPCTAILPYSQALSRFPAHLQQLDMESNGKRVNRDGDDISYATGPVVFGEPGTNGQHSFYQLLHQGTDIIPLQFIGFTKSQFDRDMNIDGRTSQEKLNANLVAQIVAFAIGHHGATPNKHFPGDRPSSLLYGERLTPRSAGALLSHYENKVMFQGFAWNLNSFDQEGVQLGKLLAGAVLDGSIRSNRIDESTTSEQTTSNESLIQYARLFGIDS